MLLTPGHPSIATDALGAGQSEGLSSLWPTMVLTQEYFDPQGSPISSGLALGRANKTL